MVFFFWLHLWHVEILGSNLSHSTDLSHCSGNAGTLTCCIREELLISNYLIPLFTYIYLVFQFCLALFHLYLILPYSHYYYMFMNSKLNSLLKEVILLFNFKQQSLVYMCLFVCQDFYSHCFWHFISSGISPLLSQIHPLVIFSITAAFVSWKRCIFHLRF